MIFPSDDGVPAVETIGILGAGQLGKMAAHAATRLGCRVHVFARDHGDPAAAATDLGTVASYDDVDAVRRFAESVDVITYETEHVPAEVVRLANAITPVHPSPRVLAIAQDRLREKRFLRNLGMPVAPFVAVDPTTVLPDAMKQVGAPAVLKTARAGYDGRGQRRIETTREAEQAWRELETDRAVLEQLLILEAELSVIVARGADGRCASFGPIDNVHVDHILDRSVAPGPFSHTIAKQARQMGERIAEALGLIGVVCVEMFLTDSGRLLINELAPRPHNSGHLTIEACATSQFEQLIRAVAGLPLGEMSLFAPAAMVNLLGRHLEGVDGAPDAVRRRLLAAPGAALHLYGKREVWAGRKLGHLTVLGHSTEEAIERANAARDRLACGDSRSTDDESPSSPASSVAP